MRWCVMCIFLFLRFYNFIEGIVRIYTIFFKKLRPLFLHLTDELAQIFITFNSTGLSMCGKRIVLIYLYTLYKAQRMSDFFFLLICSRFSFVSNATNFFIHSLNRFVLKKGAYLLLVLFNLVPFSILVHSNITFKCL